MRKCSLGVWGLNYVLSVAVTQPAIFSTLVALQLTDRAGKVGGSGGGGGGTAKWHSHYGKQYGGSSKI
jgi:hypothetical protein